MIVNGVGERLVLGSSFVLDIRVRSMVSAATVVGRLLGLTGCCCCLPHCSPPFQWVASAVRRHQGVLPTRSRLRNGDWSSPLISSSSLSQAVEPLRPEAHHLHWFLDLVPLAYSFVLGGAHRRLVEQQRAIKAKPAKPTGETTLIHQDQVG